MKSFLEENKIYFDTAAAVLLAFMAIIISYQANSIARAQLTVADNSQKLAMLQHLPEIKAEIQYIGSMDGVRQDRLVISNVGSDMYEFRSDEIAFISLRELQLLHRNQKPVENMHLQKARIPLTDYFPFTRFGVNQDKGVISMLNINNNGVLNSELSKFEKLYFTKDKSMASNIERYLMVGYKDKFGKKHIKYFKFGPAGESIPMDEKLGVNVFLEFKTKSEDSLNFIKSSVQEINNIWLKYRA